MSNSKNVMKQLSDEEVSNYKLIGTAGGFSLGFCVYMGQKHTPNFFERVIGYHIDEHGIGEMMSKAAKDIGLPKDKQEYITISFYEQNHE